MKFKGLQIIILLLAPMFTIGQKKTVEKKPEVVLVAGKMLTSEDSSLVKELYYSALREKAIDNPQLAVNFFKKIIDIDPQNDAALYEVAQIAFNNKDIDVAKEYAQKATTVNANNEWYWLLLANIYQEQRNFPLLDYALNELIKIAPDKVDYTFDRANALVLQNKTDEAIALYNSLEKQIGLTDEILRGRQQIYLKQGNAPKAIQELEKIVANNKSDIKNYIFLGQLYFSNNMSDKAVETYKKAKEINPLNPYISLALADVYKSLKKEDEAFVEMKNAFSQADLNIDQKVKIVLTYFPLFPDETSMQKAAALSKTISEVHQTDAKAFSLYGDVLFQQNNLKEARLQYEKALSLNKQVFAIWDQLIRIKLSQNDFKSVAKDAEEALTLFPNQAVLYFYAGLANVQLKQVDKGISFLKNAQSYETENTAFQSQIFSTLGDAYQEIKKYKESEESYDQSLKFQNNNAYTLNNYAYYLSLRNDKLDLAEKMSKKSNDIEPDNASFQDTYAWVLFKQKKYTEAKIWIEKAMNGKDNKSGVQFEHYGDILYKLGDESGAFLNWKKALELGEKNQNLQKKIDEKKYSE